jgi:dienelactone hydrolase
MPVFLFVSPAICQAKSGNNANPQELTLPSQSPSGFERNDRIWFTYYPPQRVLNPNRAPAVILLHHLGDSQNKAMHQGARFLSQQGIAAAVMILPYHTKRAVPGVFPFQRFVSTDADEVVQAVTQSVADVRTLTDWLIQRPEVDPQRLGIVGVSLGANITHIAMGQDERLRAGVAFLGGGNLPEINRTSLAGKIFLKRRRTSLSAEEIATLRQADPLTYAKNNQPRRVLMVQAARDIFIPPHTAKELWEALGCPPIQWMDTNHIALQYATKSAMRTALSFLQAAWNGDETAMRETPKVRVATIKAGFLTGLDSKFTPAVQWQALSLGKRRHMSLIGANLGISGRGPFVGLAATVTPYIDIGVVHRYRGDGLKPYASFHVVF